MRSVLAFALVSLLSVGCSVASVTDRSVEPTRNVCETSNDCGGGVCSEGVCRATEGKFSTLMFEIQPPATSSGGFASIRFLKTIKDLDTRGGVLNLSVDTMIGLTGTFVPAPAGPGCTVDAGKASDGSLPGKVTFTPSPRSLGWPAASVTVSTSIGATSGPSGEPLTGNLFSVTLPPGDYDIYVEPAVPADNNACEAPPQLFRNRHIKAGEVKLPLALPAPASLSMKLPASSAMSFKGWTAQMIDDEVPGRALSNPETIGSSSSGAGGVTVKLVYSTVIGGHVNGAGEELIRLTPPDNIDAPTFYLARSALQLIDVKNVEVDPFGDLPGPVRLDGRVEVNNTFVPAAAKVTLSATKIDKLKAGTLASYIRSYETDSKGRFSATLLPGTYSVQVVPKDPGLAASKATWTVGATPSVQAGRVLWLDESAKLTGTVLVPSGAQPVVGAVVQAVASPAKLLYVGVLAAALVPRASSGVVSDKGLFTLRADPGTFDVSVRPPDGTGFAWLVRPNVLVGRALVNLGQMKLPLPVVYSGQVSVQQDVPVPGALIRAYIYMDSSERYTSDPALAKSVLSVAETRADSDGHFKLLLPAHLN